ncbi:site-specific integrase [bacterium]|nr:site-specific integrase [Akkermansiaceae bacterium]MDA7621692.1 site-specific integrase [bacterium]MDA7658117.1 site-specific integrase [bacterium]
MSSKSTRARISPKKSAASKITVKFHTYKKNGKFYSGYLVQGWQENGKWKRKQFKTEEEANTFAALREIELKNQGRAVRMVNTSLEDKQVEEAERAFSLLGGTYSLTDAVNYFLSNHRPPDFAMPMKNGYKLYIDSKEDDALRARSLKGIKDNLSSFVSHVGDMDTHEVTMETVEIFLKSLRAQDGVSPAKRKTWNTYRSSISGFFQWAMEEHLKTNRPWCFVNPVDRIKSYTNKQIAEQRPPKSTTDPATVLRIFSFLMRYRGGAFVKTFALAYFAGIRPSKDESEFTRVAANEEDSINLKTGKITIPAKFSKTRHDRKVDISDNLRVWLEAYKDFPFIPTNFGTPLSKIRCRFGLKRDETRHSFISYYVAFHNSRGKAALQGGTSETMVRQHYDDVRDSEEAKEFFSIVPDIASRRAVFGNDTTFQSSEGFRAI